VFFYPEKDPAKLLMGKLFAVNISLWLDSLNIRAGKNNGGVLVLSDNLRVTCFRSLFYLNNGDLL